MSHPAKVLELPLHITPFRHNKEDVSIDLMMVDIILKLWENHVITLACCQGNSNMLAPYDKPNVVVHERYDDTEIKIIREIINDPKIQILQWKENLEIV